MVTLCDRRDCGVRVEVLTAQGVPTRNEVNEANQPGGQRHERKRCRFAANKVPWRGCTVSEVRIIPVPYSDVTVTAPEPPALSSEFARSTCIQVVPCTFASRHHSVCSSASWAVAGCPRRTGSVLLGTRKVTSGCGLPVG